MAKPGVLDDQNISKKTKGQSPKKVRAIEAEPSKKRGRRSKSKGRKTGGKSELHQQMQEYQEESDPAALVVRLNALNF